MRLKTLFGLLEFELVFIMSTESKLVLSSISGIITGILVSTGHLDASSANTFQQDLQTGGGLIISLVSIIYLFEHLLIKIRAEVKPNSVPTQVTVTTPTTTIETKEPAPEVPVAPQQ